MTVGRRQTLFVFHISPCLKRNLQVTLEPVDAELLWDRRVRRVDLPQGTYAAGLIASVWAAAGALQTSVTSDFPERLAPELCSTKEEPGFQALLWHQ